MIRKYTSSEDVAYSDETRKMIIDMYEDEITKGAMASDMVIHDLVKNGELSSGRLRTAIASIVAGIFIVGFKAGNDFFMDELEDKKT